MLRVEGQGLRIGKPGFSALRFSMKSHACRFGIMMNEIDLKARLLLGLQSLSSLNLLR